MSKTRGNKTLSISRTNSFTHDKRPRDSLSVLNRKLELAAFARSQIPPQVQQVISRTPAKAGGKHIHLPSLHPSPAYNWFYVRYGLRPHYTCSSCTQMGPFSLGTVLVTGRRQFLWQTEFEDLAAHNT